MQDKVMMDGKWEFNEQVTAVFDEMLSRSIPGYDEMRRATYNIGKHYVMPNTCVMDIGCSNGNAIYPFVTEFGGAVDYCLLDVSEPMLNECRKKYTAQKNVDIRNYDLRNGVPEKDASLVLSILTLQFTPIEYRHKIVQSIYNTLIPGGCFILVEKVLGNTSDIDEVYTGEYYALKRNNQYTEAQIKNKRKSLEGVLVPITYRWNEDLLRSAGFRQIDTFWKYLNFCGFLAIK